jgi:signal-transduction protein with cAMP-binding, CBS, and nucleotidyltransferase domain
VKNAYFLSKFDEEDRLKLLYYAHFEYYEKESIVEDATDKVIIIVEGTITARSKDKEQERRKDKEFMLKAGDHFGEQGTSTNTQDNDSLIFYCKTNCKLLIIPTDALNEVNENLITIKLKDNITLLQNTPYFAKLHGKTLLPILSNAKIKKYTYGDKIIEEGNLLAGLHIIKKGQCKVCVETKGSRSVRRVQFTKNHPGKLYSARVITIKEETDKKGSGQVVYQNSIPLANLAENDTFGGRSLLPINPSNNESDHCSLLSIIADSAEVEVLIITRDLLSYLSGEQQVLFTLLNHRKSFMMK